MDRFLIQKVCIECPLPSGKKKSKLKVLCLDDLENVNNLVTKEELAAWLFVSEWCCGYGDTNLIDH